MLGQWYSTVLSIPSPLLLLYTGRLFDSLDLDGNGSLSLEELAKVLGTDAKDFLDCLDSVHQVTVLSIFSFDAKAFLTLCTAVQDGAVDKEEFMRWANSDTDEFSNLDRQLAKIYQEVAAGTLHLFSKYADKVAQSRAKEAGGIAVVDVNSQ